MGSTQLRVPHSPLFYAASPALATNRRSLMMIFMLQAVARILDANLNRAREALRVLEDHARFVLNDPVLCERTKRLRHDLTSCSRELPAADLLAARDVPGDAGTAISTPQESNRAATADIATAAAKRAAEALRSLEEYAKLVDPVLAAKFEQLRYRTYEAEQALFSRTSTAQRLLTARLHVLVTEALCAQPWLETARAVIDGGADVLQLREKSLPDRELLNRALRLCRLAHDNGVAVVINDRPDIARLAGADAVHVGQEDLSIAETRRMTGPQLLIGRSTHSIDQVRRADANGADYIAVGPMFASATKPQSETPGPPFAEAARALTQRPIVAIGGITPATIPALLERGVRCVAVCQAVIAADDPASACRDLLAAIGQSAQPGPACDPAPPALR